MIQRFLDLKSLVFPNPHCSFLWWCLSFRRNQWLHCFRDIKLPCVQFCCAGLVPAGECWCPLLAGGNDRDDEDIWPRTSGVCSEWFSWGIPWGTFSLTSFGHWSYWDLHTKLLNILTSEIIVWFGTYIILASDWWDNSVNVMVFLCLISFSLSVFYPAPGVQFPAKRTSVSPRHQALLSQHQVPPGQQQRCLSSTCGETLFSHLHEAASCCLSPHQALLHLTGMQTIWKDCCNLTMHLFLFSIILYSWGVNMSIKKQTV